MTDKKRKKIQQRVLNMVTNLTMSLYATITTQTNVSQFTFVSTLVILNTARSKDESFNTKLISMCLIYLICQMIICIMLFILQIVSQKLMIKLEQTDILPENDIIDVIDDIHCPRFEVNSYNLNEENDQDNQDIQIVRPEDLQFDHGFDIPGIRGQLLGTGWINNQINYVGVLFGGQVKNLSNLTVLFMTIIFTVVYLGAYIYGFKVY